MEVLSPGHDSMMTPGGLKAVELRMMNYFGASWIRQKTTVSVGEGYGIYGPWRPDKWLFILLRHEISTKPYRVLNSHDVWGRHLFQNFSPYFFHIWNILGSSITVWQRLLISLGFPMFPYQEYSWDFESHGDFRTRWLRSGTWCQSGRWYRGWMIPGEFYLEDIW